jgi:hypothetical protein
LLAPELAALEPVLPEPEVLEPEVLAELEAVLDPEPLALPSDEDELAATGAASFFSRAAADLFAPSRESFR